MTPLAKETPLQTTIRLIFFCCCTVALFVLLMLCQLVQIVFGGCQDVSLSDGALGDTWTFDLVRRTWYYAKKERESVCE